MLQCPPSAHPLRQRRQPPTFHPEDPGGRAAGRQAAEGQRLALQQHLVLQLDVENGGKIWKAEGGSGCGSDAHLPSQPRAAPTRLAGHVWPAGGRSLLPQQAGGDAGLRGHLLLLAP